MVLPVTFGFTIPQFGATFGLGTLRELLAYGPKAEETGFFDALWLGDSITAKRRPESLTCLSTLAGMTEKVRLAVGCMATFPVRDPVVFAYQWASLDQVSEGRALLSVCNGLQPNGASAREGALFGIPDKERRRRLEENMDLCRLLWSGKPVSFEGEFHTYEDVHIGPAPVQDPMPIWVTANPKEQFRARSLQRVARKSDGWMSIYSDSFADSCRELKGYLKDEGRDGDNFPIALYHSVNIGDSEEQCLEDALRFSQHYYGPKMTEAGLRDIVALGTPDDCIQNLLRTIRDGANHVAIRCASFDQQGQFKRLVTEVLPAVRSELGLS